jgi:hypothetical protein
MTSDDAPSPAELVALRDRRELLRRFSDGMGRVLILLSKDAN